MKQKNLSQMNKEKKLKPMTLEEEYRNADVPIPNDLLNISNTEKFIEEATDDYKSGGAYKAMMDMFADQLDDEKFVEHCKKFFKGEKK
jgi:hypothetical protein